MFLQFRRDQLLETVLMKTLGIPNLKLFVNVKNKPAPVYACICIFKS